jgi:hypothetical protein
MRLYKAQPDRAIILSARSWAPGTSGHRKMVRSSVASDSFRERLKSREAYGQPSHFLGSPCECVLHTAVAFSVFAKTRRQYFLMMYPCQAPGFVCPNPDTTLFTEGVVIHTMNPIGVVPRSYAPPGYASAHEGNYNNVAGFLENGNQRSAIVPGPVCLQRH